MGGVVSFLQMFPCGLNWRRAEFHPHKKYSRSLTTTWDSASKWVTRRMAGRILAYSTEQVCRICENAAIQYWYLSLSSLGFNPITISHGLAGWLSIRIMWLCGPFCWQSDFSVVQHYKASMSVHCTSRYPSWYDRRCLITNWVEC